METNIQSPVPGMDNISPQSKKPTWLVWVTLVVLLALAGALGYFFYPEKDTTYKNQTNESRKFKGSLVAVEGNTVRLHGVFDGRESEERDFSFLVDDKTQYKKLVIQWPAWETLVAGGETKATGRIKLADLPRTETEGSLTDLQSYVDTDQGMFSVEADFPSNIYEAENPVASMVFYRIVVMPKRAQ